MPDTHRTVPFARRIVRRWRRARHAVPEPTVRRRSRRAVATWSVLAVVAAVVPVAVWAGTPGSDPNNGSWIGGLVVSPGPEQLVVWNLPGSGGVHGTCIKANQNGPLRGPYSRSRVVNDPVYGELNHLYATSSTSDIRLAELSALNSHKYDVVDKAVQWSYIVNGAGGTSVSDAGAMLQHATDLAGPYRVTFAVPSFVRAGPTYAATVSVTSARGVPVPGARVTLSADGAHLSTSAVTTGASGTATFRFTVPAGASTSYTLHGSVQSWTNVAVYTAPGEQQMLAGGPATEQRGSRTGTITRDRAVTLVKVAADDPAHTPVPGYVFRITDAAGHVVIASVTSGTAPVSIGRLRMGAKYTATETGWPSGGALYIPIVATTTFTVPDGDGIWQLVVADPRIPKPALATQVAAELALVGDALSDRVTVSGDDGEDGTIDAVRYGPVAPPAPGGCASVTLAQYLAAPAVHVTAAVSGSVAKGNSTVVVTGPAVTAAGCYGWAETLTLRPSGATATSPPTTPHESTLVTTPALTTTAALQTATAGSSVVDNIVVTGTSGRSATVSGRLLGPVTADGTRCTALDWSHAPVAGTFAPIVVTGDTEVRTSAIPITVAGCYTFDEQLTVAGTGTIVQSKPGVVVETVLLRKPAPHAAARQNHPEQPQRPTSAPLANTGAAVPPGRAALVGAGLLLVGAAVVSLGRRRRARG